MNSQDTLGAALEAFIREREYVGGYSWANWRRAISHAV
jgi:hypothetical protein